MPPVQPTESLLALAALLNAQKTRQLPVDESGRPAITVPTALGAMAPDMVQPHHLWGQRSQAFKSAGVRPEDPDFGDVYAALASTGAPIRKGIEGEVGTGTTEMLPFAPGTSPQDQPGYWEAIARNRAAMSDPTLTTIGWERMREAGQPPASTSATRIATNPRRAGYAQKLAERMAQAKMRGAIRGAVRQSRQTGLSPWAIMMAKQPETFQDPAMLAMVNPQAAMIAQRAREFGVSSDIERQRLRNESAALDPALQRWKALTDAQAAAAAAGIPFDMRHAAASYDAVFGAPQAGPQAGMRQPAQRQFQWENLPADVARLVPQETHAKLDKLIGSGDATEAARYMQSKGISKAIIRAVVQRMTGEWSAHAGAPEGELLPNLWALPRFLGLMENPFGLQTRPGELTTKMRQ